MGIPVMVYGESGTGKSASMRNWQAGEVSIVNVSGKPLPFRNRGIAEIRTADYAEITRLLAAAKSRTVVIDDASYLLVDEYMRNAKQGGFQKFTDMALHFYNLIRFVIDRLPEDKIVFFLGHVERDQNGNEKFKTVGRLLDEKVTVDLSGMPSGEYRLEAECPVRFSVADGRDSVIVARSSHTLIKMNEDDDALDADVVLSSGNMTELSRTVEGLIHTVRIEPGTFVMGSPETEQGHTS